MIVNERLLFYFTDNSASSAISGDENTSVAAETATDKIVLANLSTSETSGSVSNYGKNRGCETFGM